VDVRCHPRFRRTAWPLRIHELWLLGFLVAAPPHVGRLGASKSWGGWAGRFRLSPSGPGGTVVSIIVARQKIPAAVGVAEAPGKVLGLLVVRCRPCLHTTTFAETLRETHAKEFFSMRALLSGPAAEDDWAAVAAAAAAVAAAADAAAAVAAAGAADAAAAAAAAVAAAATAAVVVPRESASPRLCAESE